MWLIDMTQLKSSDTFRGVTQPLAIFSAPFDESHFAFGQSLQKQPEHFIFGNRNTISETKLFAKFIVLGNLRGGELKQNMGKISALRIVRKHRCQWRSSCIKVLNFSINGTHFLGPFRSSSAKLLNASLAPTECSLSVRVHHVVSNTPYMSDVQLGCHAILLTCFLIVLDKF